MQKTFLLLLFIIITVNIQAQKKVNQVIYSVAYNTDLLFEELHAKKEDTTSEELISERSLKTMLINQLHPEKLLYTLTDSIITMKRQGDITFSKTFYTYWKDSLAYKITELDALGNTTSTSLINMDYKKDPAWEVVYTIEHKPKERKQILGFDCYKVLVTEKRVILESSETIFRKMEMYVTDQIMLPAYIVTGLYEKVVSECPLELIDLDVKTLKPKTILKTLAVN